MQPHNESSNNNKANYDKSNRNGSYYYDLHTHIIPGVDDGSDSLEESRGPGFRPPRPLSGACPRS